MAQYTTTTTTGSVHPSEEITSEWDYRMFGLLSWGAIFGGTITAIGIHLLMSALGAGLGLATFSPMTTAEPVEQFSTGAAIVWTICALIALGFGGYVAGRFANSLRSGFVHGVLVWSLSLIITVMLLSMGTGMVLGGTLRVLGQGLNIGGQAAASVVGNVTQEITRRNGDQVTSFVSEAVESGTTNTAPGDTTRARREVGFAVTRLFSPDNDVTSQDNRTAAIQAIMQYTGKSEQDATRMVDNWTASYNELKAELANMKEVAEQKAREAAAVASANLASAAIWSFFGLLIGLLITGYSAKYGAKMHARYEAKRPYTR